MSIKELGLFLEPPALSTLPTGSFSVHPYQQGAALPVQNSQMRIFEWDGDIYLSGGKDSHSIWLYNRASESFTLVADDISPDANVSFGEVNGDLYMFGVRFAYKYQKDGNGGLIKTPLNSVENTHVNDKVDGHVFEWRGYVCYAGGSTISDPSKGHGTIVYYDPVSDTSHVDGAIFYWRAPALGVEVYNNDLYFFNVNDPDTPRVSIYNPDTSKYETISVPCLNVASACRGFRHENMFYAFTKGKTFEFNFETHEFNITGFDAFSNYPDLKVWGTRQYFAGDKLFTLVAERDHIMKNLWVM